MKRIFYGVNGEGLGHASRTLAVMDQMPDVEFHIFTYGKAHEFFQRIGYPYLYKIDGIMFSYKNGAVDYLKTASTAWDYYWNKLESNLQKIVTSNTFNPDLFVSDFEPSIPRAAKLLNIPLVSVDNQHRFCYDDLLRLPLKLRMYGWGCGLAAKMLVPNPVHTVISTFHYDKLKVKRDGVTVTNGLLRKSLADKLGQRYELEQNHVLVYVRDSVCEKVLKAVAHIQHPVVVFNANKHSPMRHELERRSNFTFREPSPQFTDYLLSSSCVISTAGNQLLSEARHFLKPVLVIPEPKQYEQSINAHYAQYLHMGRWCELDKLTPMQVDLFMMFKRATYLRYEPLENGAEKVAEVLRRYL